MRPIAYRVEDAARLTGLSRSTLFAMIRDGALPSVKVAGRRLVRHADLEALFAESGAESGAGKQAKK